LFIGEGANESRERVMSKKSAKSRMPVLFIGHGSPMNAIEDNEFTKGWRDIASEIPKPEAILCISAHWFIPSTMVTAMDHPRTIHDFWGFPGELYEQQYPANGNPDLAELIVNSLSDTSISLDDSWGLDHGTWTVLKQMYPKADIPTIQLSIDHSQEPQYHYDLGSKLGFLREQGVLIVGSGNMVHNLGMINPHMHQTAYDWVRKFEEFVMNSLRNNDDAALVRFKDLGGVASMAHPYVDHYLPLLYTKGAVGDALAYKVFNQEAFYGSVSMTCIKFE
jgi:4,5-DOPA dioxygenase extradiol